MKTPDKIYIPLYPNYDLDGFHLGDVWMDEPDKQFDNVEYINKDCVNDMLKTAEDHAYFAGQEKFREKLIEWAKENIDNLGRLSYGEFIDKLNSI